jgi:segregation and condensation protein A
VVRFLAILELFKQGYIDLEQAETFGEITVAWLGVDHGDDRSVLDELAGRIDVYEG